MARTRDDIEDEFLVLQCQNGDNQALRQLVARWQPRLAGLAWRLTHEREAVRDLVQDSLLGVVRGLRRLDDPARFRAWAYRIVRNRCADWTRRRSSQRQAMDSLRTEAPPDRSRESDPENTASEIIRLRGALATLEAEQSALLSLFYLDGLSIKELASVFDAPPGTIKSRLHNARERLKEAFERTEQ